MTERVERRLAAILSADVVGYSRLIRADEEGTLARLRAHREELIDPKVAEHHGRIVKLMGDGALVEFSSVVDAVQCAVEIQRGMPGRNADVPEEQRIEFRIGVNLGDVIIEGDDIHGDGVNVASRLEALADPGEICIAANVFEQVRHRLELSFADLGDQQVKNIPEPVRAYRVLLDPAAAGTIIGEKLTATFFGKYRRWAIPVAAAVVVIAAAAGVLLSLKPWVARVEAAVEASIAFPLPDKPSIAVLPFESLSEDPEQSRFADGVTGDIITPLSKHPRLFVIDRHSSNSYKDKAATVKQVAEELGVRFVLQGSVQRSSDKLRISTQLIDALSGTALWSERYDRPATDLFTLQDEITRNVSVALEVSIGEGEQARIWRDRSGESLEAWELDMEAWEHIHKYNKTAFANARELWEKAIEVGGEQPSFLVGLARTHLSDVQNGYADDPEASFARAVEPSRR